MKYCSYLGQALQFLGVQFDFLSVFLRLNELAMIQKEENED